MSDIGAETGTTLKSPVWVMDYPPAPAEDLDVGGGPDVTPPTWHVTDPGSGLRFPTTTRTRYSLACLLAVAVSIVGLIPGIPAWLSAVAMIVFIGVAPGVALLAWLHRPLPVSRLCVIPAFGLSILIVIGAAAATVGWWSPHGIYAMIALGCAWSVIPNITDVVRDLAP